MNYYIGIDSGATATDVIGANDEGRILVNRKFKPINFNLLGSEESARRLVSIINASVCRLPCPIPYAKPSGLRSIKCIAACIAGTGDDKARGKLLRLVSNKIKFKRLRIYPDITGAFASAFDTDDTNCGVLIAGTGSVLYYRKRNGTYSRTGGWGRIIGDEGSGWWIAREALSRVMQNYDGRGKKTQLESDIKNKFRLTPQNMVKKIYHDNFEISKLTKLVFSCAENGDRVSQAIIKHAAEHLAQHLAPVEFSKSRPVGIKNRNLRIALCGSLFSEEKLLEKYFRTISEQKYPNIKFIKPKRKPVYGALKLAMQHTGPV